MELDAVDKRVLVALHEDGRATISKLSKQCRVSRDVVQYRMRKLEDADVIRGYVARIDQSLFCQGVAALRLKLARANPQQHATSIAVLQQHKAVNWIAELCGGYDIQCTLLYRSPEELADTVADITSSLGAVLKRHELSLHITEYKFERLGVLTGQTRKKLPQDTVNFGKQIGADIDEADRTILGALAANCRATNTALAKLVKLSEDAIRLRIKKLEKGSVIKGYTIVINPVAIGLEPYIVWLQLEQMTKATIAQLRSYAHSRPAISYCARTAGGLNVVLTLYVRDRRHFNEELTALRQQFGELLTDYEILLGLQEHKEVFLPEGFLK
jgi:Lrp/AsnC family transcriptional regulator, leucine-responsive regulatory protein